MRVPCALAMGWVLASLALGCAGGAEVASGRRTSAEAPAGGSTSTGAALNSSQGTRFPSASPNWLPSVQGPVPSPKAIDPKDAVERAKANVGKLASGGASPRTDAVATDAAATPAQVATQAASPVPARP